jgi:DNA modification methylase
MKSSKSGKSFGRDGVADHVLRRGRVRREAMEELVAAEGIKPGLNDLYPDLAIVMLPIGELAAARRKVRKQGKRLHTALKRSLARFGWVMPILIDGEKRIVAGHGLIAAARELGLESVPCIIVTHLKPHELEMLSVALNRAGELGEWDFEVLKDVFDDYVLRGEDLADSLFVESEITVILDDDEGPKPEAPLEVPEVATSQLGDVWILGPHLVACCDARDTAFLLALMGDELAQVAFIDCPYRVKIQGFVTKKAHREFVMGSAEDWTDEEFFAFLHAIHRTLIAMMAPGGVAFSCMDWRSDHILRAAGEAAGFELINKVVWSKNPANGGLYRSAHEMILVLKVPGAEIINNNLNSRTGRYRSNVWTYPSGASTDAEMREGLKSHSTPKNPTMVKDALEDCSRRGQVAIDLCLGGGTTLIAAERSGRRFRGCELDPTYIDVSLLRWMRETGGMPILQATGETFEEVRARRFGNDAAGGVPADDIPAADFTEVAESLALPDLTQR